MLFCSTFVWTCLIRLIPKEACSVSVRMKQVEEL